MCLRPRHMLDVPEETAELAKRLFPKGHLYLTLCDELGMIFEDLDFEDLYPRRGQPAYSPSRLALITILQFLENISDRAAADAVRARIDWDQQKITCPQGKVSRSWRTFTKPSGVAYIKVRFAKPECLSCPAKALCTRSTTTGRNINLLLKEVFEAQETMKYLFTQAEIYSLYKKRAGVEGTVSQATHVLGLRRTRYRGLVKTHLQHLATATALNIKRLGNWFNAIPRAKTRVSRFAALAKP